MEGRECRLLGVLYEDDLVLCGESDYLRVIVGWFVEICKRRGIKVNARKSKVTERRDGSVRFT